jgi:hypothetical protein
MVSPGIGQLAANANGAGGYGANANCMQPTAAEVATIVDLQYTI